MATRDNDNFELWKLKHADEWAIWKRDYESRWMVEKNHYGFNTQDKETFLFYLWKNEHDILWDKWKKRHLTESRKWKSIELRQFNEWKTSYIKELQSILPSTTKFWPYSDVQELYFGNLEYDRHEEDWQKWQDASLVNWENGYLHQWKETIQSELQSEWVKCFTSYEKEDDYLKNDLWAKEHFSEIEKKESLQNKHDICCEKWKIFLNTLTAFWDNKEQILIKDYENWLNHRNDMRIFFLWKDKYHAKWESWHERYLWSTKWKQAN